MTTWHDYLKEQGNPPDWPYPIRFDEEQEIEADVMVVGGGIAGCWAAISAARQGLNVALVERVTPSGAVPEALDAAFEVVSKDTLAEGAKLRLVVVRPVVRCRECGKRFEPGIDYFLCPECNRADVEIVEGNELILKSVEFEENE